MQGWENYWGTTNGEKEGECSFDSINGRPPNSNNTRWQVNLSHDKAVTQTLCSWMHLFGFSEFFRPSRKRRQLYVGTQLQRNLGIHHMTRHLSVQSGSKCWLCWTASIKKNKPIGIKRLEQNSNDESLKGAITLSVCRMNLCESAYLKHSWCFDFDLWPLVVDRNVSAVLKENAQKEETVSEENSERENKTDLSVWINKL